MAGLREKQKEKRREEMLEAAMTLFRTHGYEAVKLEEIAHAAGLSPGTLYTYFKTKKDLLLAVIVKDFEYCFACGREVLSAEITGAVDAINKITDCHFSHRKDGPTNEMWRFAVAAFFSHPKSEFSRRYEKCLLRVHGQYVRLIRKLQDEGHLPKSSNSEEIATFLESTANIEFLEFIRKDSASEADRMTKQQRLNARVIEWVRQCN